MTKQAELIINPTAITTVDNENSQLLSVIERIALSPDADIEKLEKMIELQERTRNYNAKAEFASAFAMMQPELPEIEKKGKAVVTKGGATVAYGTFEDIMHAVKPILSKYGFGVSFRINQDNGMVKVTGILSHKGGHSESTDMIMQHDSTGSKNAVQAIASSVSYGKRHTLKALVGIAERGEDDDGTKAGDKALTEFQVESLKSLLVDNSQTARDWFANTYGCIDDVPIRMFTTIEARLKSARDKHKAEEAAKLTEK